MFRFPKLIFFILIFLFIFLLTGRMLWAKGINEEGSTPLKEAGTRIKKKSSSETINPGSSEESVISPVSKPADLTAQIALLIGKMKGDVTENGHSGEFSIQLASKPLENVIIDVKSDTPEEGTVKPKTLVFTPGNWNQKQTVQVLGQDDDVKDGDQTFKIKISVIRGDFRYSQLKSKSVSVVNRDNDQSGIIADHSKGFTTEEGKAVTMTVHLRSKPKDNVIIPITSSNPSEAKPEPGLLTFTASNWHRDQTVRIIGQNDFIADGPQNYYIRIGPSKSRDKEYQGISLPKVSYVNYETGESIENVQRLSKIGTPTAPTGVPKSQAIQPGVPMIKDIKSKVIKAGLDIGPINGKTSEAGGSAQFEICLKSAPFDNVIIRLTTPDTSEITINPAHIVFNKENWNQKQRVVLTGQDDLIMDGDRVVTVLVAVAPDSDFQYARLKSVKITTINTDDDQAGVFLGDIDGDTTETGGEAHFPVRLQSKPDSPVTIMFNSTKPKEGKVKNPQLVFTPENWDRNQIVTVVGQDDFMADNNKSYQVFVEKIASNDQYYTKIKMPRITITNRETPESVINLKPSTGSPSISTQTGILGVTGSLPEKTKVLPTIIKETQKRSKKPGIHIENINAFTSESGGIATFDLSLNVQPTVNVIIQLESDNPDEGKVKQHVLTFTPDNWDKHQKVTVIGQNDQVADGNIDYNIILKATSEEDFRYSRLPPRKIPLTNKDNDKVGIKIRKSGDITSESGDATAFYVSLESEPTDTVLIPFSSNNPREGTLDKKSLTFDPTNWNQEQKIIVTGQDDRMEDGRQKFLVVAGAIKSGDPKYSEVKSPSIMFFNKDNDKASIITSRITKSTTEEGGSVLFSIRLQTQPTKNVVLDISSSNEKEGIPKPTRIEFTPKTWSKPRNIVVSGIDDFVNDGDQTYNITITPKASPDLIYRELATVQKKLINEDNDIAGFKIGQITGGISENGDTSVFSLALSSEPSSTVEVTVTCLDASECKIGNPSVIFDEQNWNKGQYISIIGVDDDVVDHDVRVKIKIGVKKSEDVRYRYSDPAIIETINKDNDKAGFHIVYPQANTSENEESTSFKIALSSKPSASVTINLSSSDKTEGEVLTDKLVFTPDNWNQEQVVTVKGKNDQLVDGEQEYSIVTSKAISYDESYNGLDPPDIPLINLDNNLTTFFVSKISGNTEENGRKSVFSVQLKAKPKADVEIRIDSTDPSEGIPTPAFLTFTPQNWDQSRKVTVTGVDDNIADGDKVYQIILTASSKMEPAYNDIPPVKLQIRNIDNDEAGITVKTKKNVASEDGETAEFSIRLNSEPTSSVVFLFFSSNPKEGKMIDEHASFLTTDWDQPKKIKITGVKDYQIDGNLEFFVTSLGAISNDPVYNKMAFPPVKMVNKNTDIPKFNIEVIDGTTSEDGDKAHISIRLNSKPTTTVSIKMASTKPTEGILDQTELFFTPDDWSTPQEVTVTGIDDFTKDDDQDYEIVFSSSVSEDGNYHGLSPEAVHLKNIDNKRLTLGIHLFVLVPGDKLNTDFDPAMAFEIIGGYIYNKKYTFNLSFSKIKLTGSLKKVLYNQTHQLEQSMELTSLMGGIQYTFLKQPFRMFVRPGIGIRQWNFTSTTQTDGTVQNESGQDLDFNMGIGTHMTIYGNLFLEVGLSFHILTGGFGNRQFTIISSGINYPY